MKIAREKERKYAADSVKEDESEKKNSSNQEKPTQPFKYMCTKENCTERGYEHGGCLEMFHKDYPERVRGNIKEKSIKEILSLTPPC